MAPIDDDIQERPALLLQRLIRFDTSNPPGQEGACAGYIQELLTAAGVPVVRYEREPGRTNLVARISGRGVAPALLLYGHLDVVPAAGERWTHPPFEGRIVDGCVWGRGALDMKGGVAMMVAAFLRAARQGPPPGDIALALFADEESGGVHGARFVVDEHPEALGDVRYAIGEFGGFPLWFRGRAFYLIQVAEKGPAVIELTVHGPEGHGARPMRGGAVARAAGVLQRLDGFRTPIHITPVTRRMIDTIADHLAFPDGSVVRRLLHPARTDRWLRRLGEAGRNLEPLFRNTVNATVLRGGERVNVVPGDVRVLLDGRLLPGFAPEDLVAEIEPALGPDVEATVLRGEAPGTDPDFRLLGLLGRLLAARDPDAIAVPYLLPGSSDGRHLARIGIQTYGYTPMNLPPGVSFFDTIHARDERIPVSAVEFGADVLYSLIQEGVSPAP
ncbi:MAG: M20/M25/M40 family metallo-hydrolase [Candidatus Bipolaricaulia bacterium]